MDLWIYGFPDITFHMFLVPNPHPPTNQPIEMNLHKPVPTYAILALLSVLALIGGASSAFANTLTLTGTVNWNATGVGGSGPGGAIAAADTVTIAAAATVTVPAGCAAQCASISMTSPPEDGQTTLITLADATASLAVSGTVTFTAPVQDTAMERIAVGAGTFSANAVTLASTTGSPTTRLNEITISTGTVNVATNITTASTSCKVTFTGAGTLNIGGSLLNGNATLTLVSGCTINYNGIGAQTVRAASYYNLIFSGSGAKSMVTGTSVTTKLSITGSASASVGANLTVARLNLGGVGQTNGTWGGTGSVAAHVDTTWFAATSNYLTVSTSTVPTGVAGILAYTAVPATGVAGTAFSVTLQSQDVNGNPTNVTSDTTVTLSKASGGGSLSGTLTGTIANGTNSVTISTPVYSKSDSMTVTANATAGMALTAATSSSISFSAGAVTAAQSTVTASPASLPIDGFDASTVTVTLMDVNSNPVSGKTVTLARNGNSGSGTPTISTVSGTTNASGQATFAVTCSTAGSYDFEATDTTDANLVITQKTTATFTTATASTIALRGTARTATGTTSLTINKPTGVVAGDVMIVVITKIGNNTVLPVPTSPAWTSISQAALRTSSTLSWGAVMYRIADSSDASFTSYTFDTGTGTSAVGDIIAFSGVDTTGGFLVGGATGGPFDVAPGTILANTGGSAAVGGTTITTATANAVVVMLGMAAGTSTWSLWNTATSPGVLNEVADNQGASSSVGVACATKATASATGAGAATLSVSQRNGGILLALRPSTKTSTTTTVVTSGTPSTYGQSVTFTATIAPASGAVVPTGQVQFKVDGSALGSPVTVTTGASPNGTAAVSTSTIAVAGSPHAVTAEFTASGSFSSSTGTLSGGQTVTPAGSSVTNPTVGSYTYSGSAQGPNSSAVATGSTGAISYSYAGTGATSYGPNATPPTDAGTYIVTATVAEDANYNSAMSSGAAFAIAKASQTITFGSLAAKTYGDAPFALTATASSALTVSYASSDPTVAGVAGNLVTILKAGTTVITASQAGNDNYNAATPVPQLLTVNPPADSFTAWIGEKYSELTGDNAKPGADPDGDGMTNQQEFAFGLDPTKASSCNPIVAPLDKTTRKFSYTRRVPADTGLGYSVLTSTDMVTWMPNAAAQTVISTVNGVQTIEVTLAGTLPSDQLFVRVQAE